jgi:hypothetical protein
VPYSFDLTEKMCDTVSSFEEELKCIFKKIKFLTQKPKAGTLQILLRKKHPCLKQSSNLDERSNKQATLPTGLSPVLN